VFVKLVLRIYCVDIICVNSYLFFKFVYFYMMQIIATSKTSVIIHYRGYPLQCNSTST